MKVLLTGHQGYLGTVMAPVLQAAGHDVTGLDVGWFADCVLGPAPPPPPSRPDARRAGPPAHRGGGHRASGGRGTKKGRCTKF